MIKNLFAAKIDAVIVTSNINRFYLTKFDASYGFLVLTENFKTFYTDLRYYHGAKEQLQDFGVKAITADNAYAAIAKDLTQAGIKTVGYEDSVISVKDFKDFKAGFKNFTLKGIGNKIDLLRLVKTEAEINAILDAQHIAEKAFDRILDFIKPSISEKELAAQVAIECLKLGADDMAFSTIVAFGANSAIPHHKPSDKKLEKNDIILLDYGVKLNGYNSDMTRSFCIGEPAPQIISLFDTVLSAQNYALTHLKAGISCHEADSLAREYIRANGLEKEFSHSLGHGIGLVIHESPRIKQDVEDVLLPGMVVSVEPGIYIAGVGGVRLEDMVVIKEDGIENLTSTPKRLIY